MSEVDRGDLVEVAWALLMAAILLRDLAGALPPSTRATMPPDIAHRLYASHYQDAFELLPADVREEVTRLVSADPDVQNARAIHAEHNVEEGAS